VAFAMLIYGVVTAAAVAFTPWTKASGGASK